MIDITELDPSNYPVYFLDGNRYRKYRRKLKRKQVKVVDYITKNCVIVEVIKQ